MTDLIQPNRPATVLVVEDAMVNRRVIQHVLQSESFIVMCVENGLEAIQAYKEHPEIDLVLMDIRMPVMNGDVAAKEILKVNKEAKIIAQTAHANHDDVEAFLKIGFVDYISKPFRPKDLKDITIKWTS